MKREQAELLACQLCEEEVQDQYTIRNALEAPRRVLCYNPTKSKEIKEKRQLYSILGTSGHVERMSAWTHIVACVGFATYAIVRPWTSLNSTTVAGRLLGINAAVAAGMFGISTVFHIYGTHATLSAALRQLDHGAIYVSLAMSSTSDIAIATLDFQRIPWQTVGDALIVSVLLLCFFTYRRVILPEQATEVGWGNKCTGLYRRQHADFSHASLRSAGYFVLTVLPLLFVPATVANLSFENAAVLISVNAVGAVLMVAGVLMDNVLVYPDTLYDYYALEEPHCKEFKLRGVKSLPWFLCCHSRALGCACISHALWHVIALVASVLVFIGREIVVNS